VFANRFGVGGGKELVCRDVVVALGRSGTGGEEEEEG